MPDYPTYKERRIWGDNYMSAVKALLGQYFFQETDFEKDAIGGIDLQVHQASIAVRVRDKSIEKFNDFALRASGGRGVTEYEKLLDRKGPDYILYGFAKDETTLSSAYLIDLQQWRTMIKLGKLIPQQRQNPRDKTLFFVFPLRAAYAEKIL